MSIIYVLIPLAIIIVSIAIGLFFWAVKSNQFDDLERQGYSILFDDDIKQPVAKEEENCDDSSPSNELKTQTTTKNSSPSKSHN